MSHREPPRDKPRPELLFRKAQLNNATEIMRAPLWNWVNDWLTSGAVSTLDVFTGIDGEHHTQQVLIFGFRGDETAEDIADQFLQHLAWYCRERRIDRLDLPLFPDEKDHAPSSNTGRTDSEAPTAAREMGGFEPNIGHIPPRAADV